jgi:hypothetical protein
MSAESNSGAAPQLQTEPRILRIFISYASEDLLIATAVAKSLRDALGDVFAEVNIDRWFLEAGEEFRKQIEAKLEKTDVFISLYTGADKQWPAWEVGFFERGMKASHQKRTLVPIFLDRIPPAISQYQSLGLSIPASHLQLSLEQFTALNNDIREDDPICKFLIEQQETVDKYREAAGYPKAARGPDQDPIRCVQRMKIAIYNYLRTTAEAIIKPQKQILVRTTGGALQGSEIKLPNDAQLIPEGEGGAMSIFGLTETPRTWEAFLQETAGSEHAESWRAAILSVITSSLDSRIDVDNSQIILSSDEAKAYRVILTSAIKYYDDKREFHLYLVETLQRGDYGDELTSLLLKALEFTCRFHFLFFEKGSPFSSVSVGLIHAENLPATASKMIRELDLLRKDSRDAGLDRPNVWLRLVDDPARFKIIVDAYQPRDKQIREITARITEARGHREALVTLQTELSAALDELKQTVEPGNAELIRELSAKLQFAAAKPAE